MFMGQTAVLDDVMEDFIEELKSKNLWDNTLIVFSSDNGAVKDSGDNAPLRGAKSSFVIHFYFFVCKLFLFFFIFDNF